MSAMRLPDSIDLQIYYENFKEAVEEISSGLIVDSIRNLGKPKRHYYTDISETVADYVFNYMETIGDVRVILKKYNTRDGAVVFMSGSHHDAPTGETYKFELKKEVQ
jgi:hypothetical protein